MGIHKERVDLFFGLWESAVNVDESSTETVCNAHRVALWMRAGFRPDWNEAQKAEFLAFCERMQIDCKGLKGSKRRSLIKHLFLKNPTGSIAGISGDQLFLTDKGDF